MGGGWGGGGKTLQPGAALRTATATHKAEDLLQGV